ncbi:MAG TPA: TIGR04283 family arsenosugar biosynthesis glycosyltransferase [Vicinamibacterales bacterium]|nr:TIGR04283 family arsenosugar biosynthesis glycosyltransferase [Vicinamibacterales bacterium]
MDSRDDPLVTIVIPVLDDTAALASVLPGLQHNRAVEIVVVDGGEPDESDESARARLRVMNTDVMWIQSPPGRGAQMNRGAREGQGRWLLFLHADTRLGDDWIEALRAVDARPESVGGSFAFRLDTPAWWARWIEWGVRVRVRLFNLPYGDQALFVRRAVFEDLGAFRELPLMEDVDFVVRLRKRGRLDHLRVPAVTSPRRWERDGWLRRSLENAVLVLLFFAGLPPARLARRYNRGARR